MRHFSYFRRIFKQFILTFQFHYFPKLLIGDTSTDSYPPTQHVQTSVSPINKSKVDSYVSLSSNSNFLSLEVLFSDCHQNEKGFSLDLTSEHLKQFSDHPLDIVVVNKYVSYVSGSQSTIEKLPVDISRSALWNRVLV